VARYESRRDGSLQTCNSHTGAPHSWQGTPSDPGLDIFSYDIFLTVSHGTVVWGEFEEAIGFKKLPNDELNTRNDTQIHITRFADLGYTKSAGRYKLGSMTVSIAAGTPSIFFAPMIAWITPALEPTQRHGWVPKHLRVRRRLVGRRRDPVRGTINHEPEFVQRA